ncbi:unnamed protein product [Bursaphelenchus xylophilus]|uniref:(pine wood nematode) hypothetical protein n=1 Tax=Bursaphelenchus xylophilus TaxID=6326 RepID=A0A7I8WPH5_BURXY|nr:unnamed protein product [Bursaphelenchus xylophilus]CAG9094684.1 unnamed protein product [Bursaphelenchus xylophilus]
MAAKTVSALDCSYCFKFMGAQIAHDRTKVLDVYDQWLNTVLDCYSLSEYITSVKVPAEGTERENVEAGLKSLMKVCIENIEHYVGSELKKEDVPILAGFFTLILEFHRSIKQTPEFWKDLKDKPVIEKAYSDALEYVSQLKDGEVKDALKTKVPTLSENLSANETIHNFHGKMEELIESLKKFEAPQEILDEIHLKEDFEFDYNVGLFKQLADLEKPYMEAFDAKKISKELVEKYYEVLGYVLVNVDDINEALEYYEFQPELEEKRLSLIEALYNYHVGRTLNLIPAHDIDDTLSTYISKIVNVLLILAPVKFLTVLFKRQAQKTECASPIGAILLKCRKGLAQKIEGSTLAVHVLKKIFEELEEKQADQETKKLYTNLVKSLCKQRIDFQKQLVDPVVSPTEVIRHFIFESPASSRAWFLNLAILTGFFDAPDKLNRSYPINFDPENGEHVEPADLITYIVTLHKLIAADVTRGSLFSAPDCLKKLGEKFYAERVIVDDMHFLNHQLSECLWSVKYFASRYLFKTVTNLTHDIPEVLYRLIPEENRRRFRPITYPGEENISDLENLLYSIMEMALTSPELTKSFIADYALDFKLLNTPEKESDWRNATAQLISLLTNKCLKVEEFKGLVDILDLLIRKADWPLPFDSQEKVTVECAALASNLEPIFVLGAAVLNDLAEQRYKVNGNTLIDTWNPSTQNLVDCFCFITNERLSKQVNIYAPKNTGLDYAANFVASPEIRYLNLALFQILSLIDAIVGLNLPLDNPTIVANLAVHVKQLVNRMLPWNPEEIKSLGRRVQNESAFDKLKTGFERAPLLKKPGEERNDYKKEERISKSAVQVTGFSRNDRKNMDEEEKLEKQKIEHPKHEEIPVKLVEGAKKDEEKQVEVKKEAPEDISGPSEAPESPQEVPQPIRKLLPTPITFEEPKEPQQVQENQSEVPEPVEEAVVDAGFNESVPFEPSVCESEPERSETIEILKIETKDVTEDTPKGCESEETEKDVTGDSN